MPLTLGESEKVDISLPRGTYGEFMSLSHAEMNSEKVS
jgi:hypothetical protein